MGADDSADQSKSKATPDIPSDDNHDSSGDSDFIVERRPTRPARPVKRKAREVVDGDANTNCSICTRPWHSSGDHRICCLRCGHLFGRSCIHKWIQLRACCPECQKRARLSDITVLFTSKFAVKDTCELHDLASKVENEQALRRRAESELLTMRHKYTRLQERFAQLRSALACSDAPFVPIESVALRNARVLHHAGGSLLVSCASDASHGFRRFSLLDVHAHQRFLALHHGEIRDLNANANGLVASASLDKHLKVTSLSTESCVADFDMTLPVWSCCFRDPFTIVAGTANGQLVAYDLRRPGSALARTMTQTPRPISMLRMLDESRMLCAGPGHATIATFDSDLTITAYTDLPIDEKRCIGASVGPTSSEIVVTLRSEQRPYASHTVIDLEALAVTAEMSTHTIGVALTRAVLFEHGGRRWVGSGDQESKAPWLWEVSRPDEHCQIASQPSGVLDMAYVNGTLITLSSSSLNLYKGHD